MRATQHLMDVRNATLDECTQGLDGCARKTQRFMNVCAGWMHDTSLEGCVDGVCVKLRQTVTPAVRALDAVLDGYVHEACALGMAFDVCKPRFFVGPTKRHACVAWHCTKHEPKV